MLDRIFAGEMTDTSRFSVPGLIVMALGVIFCAFAKKISGESEKLYFLLKLGGLLIAMVGALLAVKLFG